MDEEERKRIEQQMLMGQLRQDAMLQEQSVAQVPIAPATSAPAPQVQAPAVESPSMNMAVAPSSTIPEASYTMPDGSIRNVFPESTIPRGAFGSPQENFRQRMLGGEPLTAQEIEQANAFAGSMETTFDPLFGYAPLQQPIAPQMGPMRPVDPRTGEFLSQDVIAAGEAAGMTFPSQVSLPVPQAPQASIAPMGPEETIARLNGRTLNEYLNAPAVKTPGISGLKTDPQGRMIPNVGQFQTQPVAPQPAGAIAPTPVPLSTFEQESQARQDRINARPAFNDSISSQNVPQDVRTALATPASSRTPEQRDRVATWSSSTQGQQAGGEAGYQQSIKTEDQKKAEALAIETQEIANEAARKNITYAEAAEARKVAAEVRADALLGIQKEQEARAARGEDRTIAAGIAAQAHAAKSQEQRDEEIKIKQSAENRQILDMQQTDPQAYKDATDAQIFMNKENLVFDNGVLYKKEGWLKGQLIEVTNPAFMNLKGMKLLQEFSRGATGSASPAPVLPLLGSAANAVTSNAQGAPVDYSAFSVRAVGTPAPTTVTVPPTTTTNNAVNSQALSSVAQPVVSDPSARRADETKTSYAMRIQREKNARRLAAFLASR